jgi:hypothetical protein
MEDHAVEQQQELDGIGNLGEDFDERNNQDQAKADWRLGCVQNFAAREKLKSLEELQTKDSQVQAKLIDIKGKRKRKQSKVTVARQATKRQRQLDA